MALGDVIARLAVLMTMDTVAFEKGATLAEKRFEQSRKRFEKMGASMTKIGVGMSAALTAPLVALGTASVKAAIESRDALAQVESALKSMGDAAGRTSEQLQALATGQMRQSLYDDDEILRKVTANLLTFGKISGETFDQAQQAALDLSARLNTDLKASAIMVGKALNDPIKGVTALTRVGVSFTAQQKEQIKAMAEAGNVAGAQAMILQELQKQYGGAAKAAREADPLAATRMSWNEFQETIGEKILPLLPVLADAITSVLDAFTSLSPGMQKAIVIGGAVVAALGPLLALFGGIVTIGGPLLSLIVALAPAMAALGSALLLIAANPVVLAFAAVIGGIYLAWKHWDKIEPILRALYEAAKRWIGEGLKKILGAVPIQVVAVGAAFKWLYDVVAGHSYIPDMVDAIAMEMARLDQVMVAQAGKATTATAKKFQDLRNLLDRLFPDVVTHNRFVSDMAALGIPKRGQLDPVKQEQWIRLQRELAGVDVVSGASKSSPDFGGMGGPITEGLDDVGDSIEKLTERSKIGTVKIAESFKDMAEKTLQSLSGLATAIKDGDFLDIVESVLNLGLQLAGSGAFGSNIARKVNSVPGYAKGTNFHPGGLAMVGERGPELVSMPRGSRVIPSGKFGGNVYHISGNLLTEEFWARIVSGDFAAAQAGERGGVARIDYRNSRRVG